MVYVFRPQYFKLIEECISQIVLHRSGVDPDFRYTKRFEIDVDPLIGRLPVYDVIITTNGLGSFTQTDINIGTAPLISFVSVSARCKRTFTKETVTNLGLRQT